MTLKQFFQLAAGAVLGLIIYSLPLPGFLKWPFIALMVIGGAAFAFLPIQDRPLEQWLAAFFRSIYRPTIFVWRKPASPAQYFATDAQAQAAQAQTPLPGAVPGEAHPDPSVRALDEQEENFLSRLSGMFSPTKAQRAAPTSPPQPEPEPEPPHSAEAGFARESSSLGAQQEPEPQKEVLVPEKPAVGVGAQGFSLPQDVTPEPLSQTLPEVSQQKAEDAQFSPDAAPPSMPSSPNLVVGQVIDINKKIVEGAILEIIDSEGRPVRALKTNRAGHFMIVTPLPNGDYTISTERDELTFDPVAIRLNGEIFEPIAIKAKDALPPPPEPTRASWSVGTAQN